MHGLSVLQRYPGKLHPPAPDTSGTLCGTHGYKADMVAFIRLPEKACRRCRERMNKLLMDSRD